MIESLMHADNIAALFLDAMRDAPPSKVAEIKRKLQRFNSKTWKWKP